MNIYLIIIFVLFFIINYILKKKELFKNNYGLNEIPLILYINLDHRKDRKESLLNQMNNFNNIKLTRIDAIKKKNGALGCALSHIKALEYAYQQNVNSVLILEDDFIWKKEYNITFINSIIHKLLNNIHWDVCLLSCNGKKQNFTNNNYYYSDIICQTTSSYIIKRKYIPILINFWKNTIKNNELVVKIDISWKELQKKDKWICCNPVLGMQLPSYSDIKKRNVNYKGV